MQLLALQYFLLAFLDCMAVKYLQLVIDNKCILADFIFICQYNLYNSDYLEFQDQLLFLCRAKQNS